MPLTRAIDNHRRSYVFLGPLIGMIILVGVVEVTVGFIDILKESVMIQGGTIMERFASMGEETIPLSSDAVVPVGCAQIRCCIETMDSNETSSALRQYSWPSKSHPIPSSNDIVTNETSICIMYNETIHSKCPSIGGRVHQTSTQLALQLGGHNDSYYGAYPSGCTVRSIFLRSFDRASVIHFEGDSIMRQLWTRLVCMARDQDSCIDPHFKSCAMYSFNGTGDGGHDRFDMLSRSIWEDPISQLYHIGKYDITLSYCFATSPSFDVLKTDDDGRNKQISMIVFGLFYWDVVSTYSKWIGSHGEEELGKRINRAKAVMFVERIPSRWKYSTATNIEVLAFLKNVTSQSQVKLGLVPWNTTIANHRSVGLEPVDPLHWMCRWMETDNLVHGKLVDCADREMRAVANYFLDELLKMFQ